MESIISTTFTATYENSLNENTCNSSANSPMKYSKIKDSCATFDFQMKASSHGDRYDDFAINIK